MIIQSEKVWLGGQFLALQLEVVDGKIASVYPYGTKNADEDYGDKRIVPGLLMYIPMALMDMIPMTGSPKGSGTGWRRFRRKA